MLSISIITATYNAASTLPDNLKCIRQQAETLIAAGYKIEHLLIDGASTDGTLGLIADYAEECNGAAGQGSDAGSFAVRYISEPDKGIYDAMNKGIGLAKGDIVGILNADDFYASNDVLTKVVQVFEDPAVAGCYGDLLYVREKVLGQAPSEKASAEPGPEDINSLLEVVRYWKSGSYRSRQFYTGWMPPHPTFFVRRSVYEQHGLFNLELGSAADYEIMLRFILRHGIKLAYIPEVLVQMRIGGVSNASVGNRLKANHNDRKAWDVNGLKPYPWTLYLKPLRKVSQWWQRPSS